MSGLEPRDLEQLERHGIAAAEAERQLDLLRHPPEPPRLDRPCTLGDGIIALDPARRGELAERWADARRAGRGSKMVPASGAATRMFKTLSVWLERSIPSRDELVRRADGGEAEASDLLRFGDRIEAFPFAALVAHELGEPPAQVAARDELERLLRATLGEDGLGLADLPKALIPFHRYGTRARTAVAEHLVEAAGYLLDETGTCRVHFTVPPDRRADFEAEAAAAQRRLAPRVGARFEVGWSSQSPATDTLAITPEGDPFRLDDGSLLVRPGGHGALLGNLAALGGDIVFLKNIDNVVPEGDQQQVAHWQAVLGGLLVEVQHRMHEEIRRLEEGADAADALTVAAELLGDPGAREEAMGSLEADALRRLLLERLDRPLRVCGVVENRGEPGGGPFWAARGEARPRRQIVEKAELGPSDEQAGVFSRSTHFNPVQLVVALRDARGRPYDLERFCEPRAVFVAEKTHDGRRLRALERPGLWNGAMAGWNTLFVGVPAGTFAPVKTVFDLLRPAHRA